MFHYCAREGNLDILNEMLRRMSGVECQRALNKQSSYGWSPLLIASQKGHAEVVRTLLENNARVDVFDDDGRTALHLGAENGYQVTILPYYLLPGTKTRNTAFAVFGLTDSGSPNRDK